MKTRFSLVLAALCSLGSLVQLQAQGAEITARNLQRANYDGGYRITGNFLNWVTTKYDTNIVEKLNAAGRAGKYREASAGTLHDLRAAVVLRGGRDIHRRPEGSRAACQLDSSIDSWNRRATAFPEGGYWSDVQGLFHKCSLPMLTQPAFCSKADLRTTFANRRHFTCGSEARVG